MLSPIVRTWIEFLSICLICTFLPSVRNANWHIRLDEKIYRLLFPLRSLVEKKVLHKNELIRAYTNIRVNGGVNFVAVFWYIFAYAAAGFLLLATIFGFLDEAGLRVFLDVVLYFFMLCVIPLAIGIFTGDRKYRDRIELEDADAEILHAHERAIAQSLDRAIAEHQAQMQAIGYYWHLDVLATDHLSDVPSASGWASAFTGADRTNPVYMSRVVVTLMDAGGQPVVFPIKRRNETDIAYTQNGFVHLYKSDYVVENMVSTISDITAVMVERAAKEK